jgi:hypothetical protein
VGSLLLGQHIEPGVARGFDQNIKRIHEPDKSITFNLHPGSAVTFGSRLGLRSIAVDRALRLAGCGGGFSGKALGATSAKLNGTRCPIIRLGLFLLLPLP